jgi:hypothetical protein
LDGTPKKYQNAGLRKDLKSKKESEVIDTFQSGGLNDEDTISSRPPFPRSRAPVRLAAVQYPQDLQRDHSRKNEVCQILSYLNNLFDLEVF